MRIVCRLDAQKRLTVVPPVVAGRSANSAATREIHVPPPG